MLPLLPFEIIEQIDPYLVISDRYQLVLVNHGFYRACIVLLYRSISVKTEKQFKQLTNLFEETKSSILPLGKYTQSLKIIWDQLKQTELEWLQQLCPFVQSIHVDGRIWNNLGSNVISSFLSVYGACRLSCLTLDLHNMNVNPTAFTCYTPILKSLTIMGIDQLITVALIESIHASCTYLEYISLDGRKAEIEPISHKISPVQGVKSFQLKCQFGADRYQDWLPYIGMKYPKLLSIHFHHAGNRKDLIAPCPTQIYRQFIQDCPLLQHMGWHNIEADFRYFQQLDQMKNQQLKQLEIYDTIAPPCLLTSCLFDSCHSILENVSRLTFGSIPRGMPPHELMASINKACPQLLHLSLLEPKCHLDNPFRINTILQQCQRLQSLDLDHIVLRVSLGQQDQHQFPLKKLAMRHCSSFDGVFDYMSSRCSRLEELSLFAHTQKDRRYKVQIHMPHQTFKTIRFQGLRTESYEAERRIRFFSVQDQKVKQWYLMTHYEIKNDMERAKELGKLDDSETRFLESILKKTPTDHLDWNDIYGAGYVDFVCKSVRNLYLNTVLL